MVIENPLNSSELTFPILECIHIIGFAFSVGTAAIERFARPVCIQDFSRELLPAELQDANPLGIWRLVDGKMIK